MKIGIVILCRHNSSRLPGKILKEINGQPVLLHIVNRLKQLLSDNEIVIATSSEQTDNPIAEFAQLNGINLFRGSLNNVANRFYEAACSMNWDYAIRINGDNLFIDLKTLYSMMETSRKHTEYDLISNVPGRTFPYGMSIEIVKLLTYQKQLASWTEEEYLEHVTYYYYQHPTEFNILEIKNNTYPNLSQLKLAIDTADDFHFAQKLIHQLGLNYPEYDMQMISSAIAKLKANDNI